MHTETNSQTRCLIITNSTQRITQMKNTIVVASLLAGAGLVAPVWAGNGHHNGGGNFSSAPSRSRGAPSVSSMSVGRFGGRQFRSMPTRSFSSNRAIYSGQRFSSIRMRSPNVNQFRSPVANSNVDRSFGRREFDRRNSGNDLRSTGDNQFRNSEFRNGTNQVRNGNQGLRPDWKNHVFAQHSPDWHRDWDRHTDHFWHGHRCHFFNGVWVVFDFGFDPWWPWWYDPYGYYGYYGYGYGYPYPYSYGYDSGYYDSGPYYGDDAYSDQGYVDRAGGSTVAAVQERLAREGYYRGAIDGVFGPNTRAALADYQSNHGLRVTGTLDGQTLAAMGLRRVASY